MRVFKDNFKGEFLYYVLAAVMTFFYLNLYKDKALLSSVYVAGLVLLGGFYLVSIQSPIITVTEKELKINHPYKFIVKRCHIFKREEVDNIEIIRPVFRIVGASPVLKVHYYENGVLKNKRLGCDLNAVKLDELRETLNEYGYHCEEA